MNLKNYKYISFWTERDGSIKLKRRDEEGKIVIETINYFKPYFYIKVEDIEKLEAYRHLIIGGRVEGNFVKVWYDYKKRWEVRDKIDIEKFEIDLEPHELLQLDLGLEIEKSYKILYFDLETDDRQGGIEVGKSRVISFAAKDEDGNEFVFCDDDERKILVEIKNLFSKYDVIVGWNSQRFDIPFIKERFRLHNIYFNFKSINHIDYIKLFKSRFSRMAGEKTLRSYSLKDVARVFTNLSKGSIEEEETGYGGRLWNLFIKDREKLLKYNLNDVEIIIALERRFHLIKTQIEIAAKANVKLGKSTSVSNVVDFLILREARKRGIHFRSKLKLEKTEQYQGPLVLDPVPGIHSNVCIFDFKSLYPSIIRTWNISPETYTLEKENTIKTPVGTYFKKEEGIIPKLIRELQEMRDVHRQAMREAEPKSEEFILAQAKYSAMKTLILSFYGILGSEFSRYFNVRVAETITLTARFLLKELVKYFERLGYVCVGGDTDSVFVKLSDYQVALSKDFKRGIEKFLDELMMKQGVEKHYIKLKLEKVFSKCLIEAKKKYFGMTIWEDGKFLEKPYIYTRGSALVKGDFTLLGKKWVDEIVSHLLTSDKDMTFYQKLILKYKKFLMEGSISPEDITITQKLSKMPDKYKNKQLPIHTAIAVDRKKRNLDRIYVGQEIPYIIVSSNPLKGVHFKEFAGEFDREYYWTNKIFPTLERILSVAFPKYPWHEFRKRGRGVQQTLGMISVEVLEEAEGVRCIKCGRRYRRPPLIGKCKCGGRLLFYKGEKLAETFKPK